MPGPPTPSGVGDAPPAGTPRRPLWDVVAANRRNSVLLMLGFGVVLGGLGWGLGETTGLGRWGLPVALGVAAALSWSSYYFSDRLVLAVSRARPADRSRHPHLVNVVEGLAIAAGLPVPRICVIDDSAPNAFATGRDPAHAVICVTTGLMEKLDRAELEGVVAHEMAHIRNYDIRLVTLASVLVGATALLSDWMLRSMRWGMWRGARGGGRNNPLTILGLVAVLLAILAPVAAQLLRFAVSRQREFLADADAALLTRYPEGLARALEKLAADTEPLEVANRATAPLYIVNPLTDHRKDTRRAGAFDTHPPIAERIRRLRSL